MATAERIIQLLRNQDEKGLEILYDNYSSALYGISFRILNNEEYAEEALQNSFLKVWNNINKYDSSKGSLFTWMSQIVRNSSLDIRRLKSFEKQKKTETFEVNVHDGSSIPRNDAQIDAIKVLNGLEGKYKIVLEYLYLKGYTQQELADELNIPLGTIKTRLRKAITILRSNLKDEKHLFFTLFLISCLVLIKLFGF